MFDNSNPEFKGSEREFANLERESSMENRDVLIGFILVSIGWCINGVPGVLLGLGIMFYFLITYLGASEPSDARPMRPLPASNQIRSTTNAPVTAEPTIADKIQAINKQNDFKCPACGATVLPTDFRCKHCGSILASNVELPRPGKWAEVEVRQTVVTRHPAKGDLPASVAYRVYYGELWQAQMRQNVPWTLTGNYYLGLGLENGSFLLNWQGRFYLLDSKSPLMDRDLNQVFAGPAREFAASNQSRNVNFTYNRTVWTIEDIGRFRIEWVDGEGSRVEPGTVGRFIHAKSGSQVLVVEDYQSHGNATDTLWMGHQIAESDIHI